MTKPPSRPDHGIERIGYQPVARHAPDIEIFSMRSLRARVAAQQLSKPHRLEFHQLLCVTEGRCSHVIDFSPIACRPGSVLVHHPSQTEQYDVTSTWDGWLVLFRPEFLFTPSAGAASSKLAELNLVGVLAALRQHLALADSDARLVRAALSRMHADSKLEAPVAELNALLRHQLSALLIRLQMAQRHRERLAPVAASELHRFRRLQLRLEQSFHEWHQVGAYANALGCSERTLTRTTMNVAGVTAKAFVDARISLEAKRLLVHTSLPVAAIGDSLGFDDCSNFVKFFKREAGRTPLAFRKEHRGACRVQRPQKSSSSC
jgi:AraC-like DNA-binding protein